jgi:hypothetical protein
VGDQPGRGQLILDPGRRQAVGVQGDGVAVGLVQVHLLVAGLEREQQLTAGTQDAAEFGEHLAELFGRGVDDRVPGDQAGQDAVGYRQRGQVPPYEAQAGVRALGHRQHAGRHVDPEDRQAQAVQVGRDAARPAARLGHRPSNPRGPHQLGERGQRGPLHRTAGQLVPEQAGVVGRHRVICGPSDGQVAGGFSGFVHPETVLQWSDIPITDQGSLPGQTAGGLARPPIVISARRLPT